MNAEELEVARTIDAEANRALARGAWYAGFFGLGSAAAVFLGLLAGVLQGVAVAGLFALVCGGYAFGVFALARRGRLAGRVHTPVMLGFVSMPTVFFLLSHVMTPAGAASFITGPYSYLYFPLIVLCGFLFDVRLARWAGLVAGLEYLAMYALAAAGLARVHADDPAMLQDLTSAPIYFLKSTMMGLAGFVVGALAAHARKLILQVLHEEREKQGISRLFGQFVSPEVKDRILREKHGVIGERKRLVVLFSDLRSFSSYSERADPALLVTHLNDYFEHMVACITAHGGVIDKFIGDAVMAVFGGVLDLDDPAGAALDAARAMRTSLRELNAHWDQQLENGIGIHYGEALQGTLGSSARKEFTVIGDAVNTASRIEGMSKELGYPIVVSAALMERLTPSRRALLVALGAQRLKGKQVAVELFGLPD